MGRGCGVTLACAAAVGASVLVPATSQGVVTVGSNLGRAPTGFTSCTPPCTVAQTALAADRAAAGGVVSPVNGTVTLWRIRVGSTFTSATAFRVVRPLAGGLSTGAGTSATVTPPLNSISSFATQLPITIGDRIGLDCCFADSRFFVGGGAARELFIPVLADGGPGRAPFLSDAFEIALNADIEPTSAFTIQRVKRLRNGKLRVTVDLPNPGTIVAGDRRDKKTGATTAARKKPVVKRKRTVASTEGPLTFALKATKAALKQLKAKSLQTGKKAKIGAKLRISFTPTGGSAAVETEKTKLRR